MAKEKQKGTVTDKGKKQLTTAEKGKKNSCPMVQVLQERNTGVVIRDEQDIMRLHEDKRKAEAMAMEKQKETVVDKGKKKITTAGNGKENLCPTVPNNNVPSKAALAQRARRDRERNERLMSASPRERGQQLRREREQFIQPLEPVYFPPLTPCRRPYSCLEQRTNQTYVNPLASKRQLVTHTPICPTSIPITSYAPQRPTPTSELLQDDACANDDVEGVPPRVTQPFICPTSVPSTSYAPQRNIAPKAGLCNGTRLMVVRCASRIIEALILSGEKFGNLAFIPRITLTPSSSEFPFRMTRRQFPIRLAYALTINKSQGQSVKFVGVDLRTPVFSHGQLYVVLSRCTSFDLVSVLLPKDELDSTANIVYPEVLL
ncbi:hypothetical protein RHSIM_Rhsim13G0061500 [Rhododendron simsii]|uniref:ATP-dependent DNA helicase n=1 Tax=Rhododendron simsii TaxID=118357 RepID=A0A834FY30_RHOSS|nr:hypothetical protein RHSIM_Rhsim13G0061500 [Rhododendron simsii]